MDASWAIVIATGLTTLAGIIGTVAGLLASSKKKQAMVKVQAGLEVAASDTAELVAFIQDLKDKITEAKKNDGKVDATELAAIISSLGPKAAKYSSLIQAQISTIKAAGN